MKPIIVFVRLYPECDEDAQLIKHLENSFAGEKRLGGKGKVLRKIFNAYFSGQALPLPGATPIKREAAINVPSDNDTATIAKQTMTTNVKPDNNTITVAEQIEDWEKTVMDFASEDI